MTFSFSFSSRSRHTRLQGDWSSDVCSSDLVGIGRPENGGISPPEPAPSRPSAGRLPPFVAPATEGRLRRPRSEERRVGKEGRGRGAGGREKSKTTAWGRKEGRHGRRG